MDTYSDSIMQGMAHRMPYGNTSEAWEILKAWVKSTPLSPVANNPIGMPAGRYGSYPYAGTKYGFFWSEGLFFDGFWEFIHTPAGNDISSASCRPDAAAHAWRVISRLHWPASDTETDYPSAVLDMASPEFRAAVGACDPGERKSSGLVELKLHTLTKVSPSTHAVAAKKASWSALAASIGRDLNTGR